MTPAELAAIHKRAMTVPRPWGARTIRSFLEGPGPILVTSEHGFALGRVIVDEAELLTIAIDPDHQGKGEGSACLQAFERFAFEAGAKRAFLEVAETNKPARALYLRHRWSETGRREGYYRAPKGVRINALVLSKGLIA